MRLPFRVGAIAPAVLVFVALAGAATADVQAQNQLERAPQVAGDQSDESEIRFVPGEVVQEMPAAIESESFAPMPANRGSLSEMVASTDTSAELSDEMLCLAQAVYFEARGESLSGQLAVAQVVINRAESGRFASSYCGVVTQPSQFSFVRGGRIPSANVGSAAWNRAAAIALIAHEGLWRSEAGDALYFHASHVSPDWARARNTRATIERHVFYR